MIIHLRSVSFSVSSPTLPLVSRAAPLSRHLILQIGLPKNETDIADETHQSTTLATFETVDFAMTSMVESARQLYRNIRARLSRSGRSVFEEQARIVRSPVIHLSNARNDSEDVDHVFNWPVHDVCCQYALEKIAERIDEQLNCLELQEEGLAVGHSKSLQPTDNSEPNFITMLQDDLEAVYSKMDASALLENSKDHLTQNSEWSVLVREKCRRADEVMQKAVTLQRSIDDLLKKLLLKTD
uniref:Uncharacterized protein n=1 Tax=Steinernema glaseri TaxID=37863 RepID=A0A1I7YK96_9BILA